MLQLIIDRRHMFSFRQLGSLRLVHSEMNNFILLRWSHILGKEGTRKIEKYELLKYAIQREGILEETPATWDLWFSKDDFICVCADLFDPDVPRFKCPLGQVASRLHDMCGLSARCYAKFQEFDNLVSFQQHCSAKGDETHLALGFVAKLSYYI